jgi:basic membrane protein A and related proteins
LLAISIALAAVGCGRGDRERAPPGGPSASARGAAKAVPLIGVALSVSESQGPGSAYAGLRALAEERGGKLVGGELEGAFGEAFELRCLWSRLGGEDHEQILGFLARGGASLVICSGPLFAAPASRAAAAFPLTAFAVLGAEPDPNPAPHNVARISFSALEGAYLAGALASLAAAQSAGRAGARLGFVGAAEGSGSRDMLAAFRAGAAARGPAAIVAAYPGRAASEMAAAASCFGKGARVVFGAGNGAGAASGRGLFEAALAAGGLAIGTGYGLDLAPDGRLGPCLLASVVERRDMAARLVLREFLTTGTLAGGDRELGVAQGCVDLAGFGASLDPYAAALDAARSEIAAGKARVAAEEDAPGSSKARK